jgi:hypothetical protein
MAGWSKHVMDQVYKTVASNPNDHHRLLQERHGKKAHKIQEDK